VPQKKKKKKKKKKNVDSVPLDSSSYYFSGQFKHDCDVSWINFIVPFLHLLLLCCCGLHSCACVLLRAHIYLFIYSLSIDAVTNTDYVTSNELMIVNNELEKMWKEMFVALLKLLLESPKEKSK
jgi:hypothetical protein